jgi:hypothetical protein
MSQQLPPVVTAPGAQRAIFRREALDHYMRGRETAVLPRYAAAPTLAFMWILLGLLLTGGVILGLSYLVQRAGG